MSAVQTNRLGFSFSEERLVELRALYEGSCNVLFLSNEALSTVIYLSRVLLWGTRWNGGERGGELPQIARDIYEELNMNTCTVTALGAAIGEALSMVINVNNQQTCSSGGSGCPPDSILPDGTVVVPPMGSPIPPDGIEEDIPDADWPSGLRCKVAYFLWETGGAIIGVIERSVILTGVFTALVSLVAAIVPSSILTALGVGSATSLGASATLIKSGSALFAGAEAASQAWDSQKDEIICSIYDALHNAEYAIEMVNDLLASVFSGLDADEVETLKRFLLAANGRVMVWGMVYGDLVPDGVPEDYECCPVDGSVAHWEHGMLRDGCILTGIYASCGAISEDTGTAQNGSAKTFLYDHAEITGNMLRGFTIRIEAAGDGSVQFRLRIGSVYTPVFTLVGDFEKQLKVVEFAEPLLINPFDELSLLTNEGAGGGSYGYTLYDTYLW